MQRCCLELGLLYFGDGDGGGGEASQPAQPARTQAAALPRALFGGGDGEASQPDQPARIQAAAVPRALFGRRRRHAGADLGYFFPLVLPMYFLVCLYHDCYIH